MVDGFLRLNEEDGLLHQYRHVYADAFEDVGPYRPNGNCLALNEVTGEIDEVKLAWGGMSWEKSGAFRPEGKTVGVRKDTGLVEEVRTGFFREIIRKGAFSV